jgi:hypothetical protein
MGPVRLAAGGGRTRSQEDDNAAEKDWENDEVIGDIGKVAASGREGQAEEEPADGEAVRGQTDGAHVVGISDHGDGATGKDRRYDCLGNSRMLGVERFGTALNASRKVQQRCDDKRRRFEAHQHRNPPTDGVVEGSLLSRKHTAIVSSSLRPVVSPRASVHLLRTR